MASNSVATFLSRLLRPDKKSKEELTNKKKRRHSAPVPDWLDAHDIITSSDNIPKALEPKHKQNSKYSSQQNLSAVKKQKSTKTKQEIKKEKRHSPLYHSWFCVSGNSDTIDRSLLPAPNNANTSASKFNAKNNQKQSKDDAPILRKGEGKKIRDNKNRYSAPVPGWSDVAKSKSGDLDFKAATPSPTVKKTVRRELSPGIKYRYDGTLEKPYVFPAGLTFGPEGRKLQLRRSTDNKIPEKPGNNRCPNHKVVRADVHRSSTEDIIMEYIYEECSPDNEEFDVRKAFYLKYDSNCSVSNHQHDYFDSLCKDKVNYNINSEPCTDAISRKKEQEGRWKPKDSTVLSNFNNGSLRNSKRRSKTERLKNRYSMPPKNEDFVYMGSFENVNLCTDFDKENQISKSTIDVSGKDRSSRRDSQKNRKNRYSLPPRNPDLVYMGSLENVNHLLNGVSDTVQDIHLSGQRLETNLDMVFQNDEDHNEILPKEYVKSEKSTGHDFHKVKSCVGGDNCLKGYDEPGRLSSVSSFKPTYESTESSIQRLECKRHSMPDLGLSPSLSIAENNDCDEHKHFEQENEEYDLFDVNSSSCGRMRSWSHNNPFSRQAGRSSCMPGNKRTFVPPPAIYNPSTSINSTPTPTPVGTSPCFSVFMPGNRRFSIPPPPNYTPPKEEMEFTHAYIKEMTCHKGSQTDLSVEFEHLNMEDRDFSLQRAEAKTIAAGTSAAMADINCFQLTGLINHSYSDHDSGVFHDKIKATKTSKERLNLSDISQGSDDVFRDQGLLNGANEFVTCSRFEKIYDKLSDCPERDNFAKLQVRKVVSKDYKDDIAKEHRYEVMINIPAESKVPYASGENPQCSLRTSMTSTPKEVRRSQFKWPPDSTHNLSPEKPVPPPRKIYSTAELKQNEEPCTPTPQNNKQQTSSNCRNKPIPKERRSLTNRSLSFVEGNGNKSLPGETNSFENRNRGSVYKLARTQSYDYSGAVPWGQSEDSLNTSNSGSAEHDYDSIKEEHFYEDIDGTSTIRSQNININTYSSLSEQNDKCHSKNIYAGLQNGNDLPKENIYEECLNIRSTNQSGDCMLKGGNNENAENERSTPLLSPLQKIRLDVSPGQVRRNRAKTEDIRSNAPSVQLPKYSGMAVSLDDVFDRSRWGVDEGDDNASVGKNCMYDVNEDNNFIADDEMSLSNEEDMDERQFSLRKCVSADNLLRSGSIVDRSMILAKRRRKRSHRHSRSHLSSFTYKEGSPGYINHPTEHPTKVHYNKKKTTSNERLYKHKPSQNTDSGHDSDMVSPCTSPDARRHADNMKTINQEQSPLDLNDACMPRQGTLPKKPWEIRLRNIQYKRKSRSRESLINLNLEAKPVDAIMF